MMWLIDEVHMHSNALTSRQSCNTAI